MKHDFGQEEGTTRDQIVAQEWGLWFRVQTWFNDEGHGTSMDVAQ